MVIIKRIVKKSKLGMSDAKKHAFLGQNESFIEKYLYFFNVFLAFSEKSIAYFFIMFYNNNTKVVESGAKRWKIERSNAESHKSY